MLIGCGSDLQDEIGRIIARTITQIEHDRQHQSAKNASPATPASLSLKKDYSAPDTPVNQAPAGSPDTTHVAMATPPSTMPPKQPQQQHQPQPLSHQQAGSESHRAYYADSDISSHPGYTRLAYGDQSQGSHMVPQPYNTDPMFFPNAHQAAAAALAAVAPGGDAHTNSLVSFASQAPEHTVDPTNPLYWERAGGNTWQDWTAAVSHNQGNQDGYGANAMLHLGPTGAAGMSVSAPPMPPLPDGTTGHQDMENQWPLVVFGQQPQLQHQQPQHPHAPHQQQQHPQHPHHPHRAAGS